MLRYLLPPLAAATLLSGCASPSTYEVVGIPERQADVYPHAVTRNGVSVVADALGEQRSERAFGAPLRELALLPVNIVISNHGEHRIEVKPADVLLEEGNRVVDPVPVEIVARAIESQQRRVDDELAAEIRDYLDEVSLKQRILAPRETYQGVLFFEVAERRASRYERFRIFRELAGSPFRLNVHATRLDPDERLAFGPFALQR